MQTVYAETLSHLGTCSLCLLKGPVRSMLITKNENEESYTDMLFQCFAIDLVSNNTEDTKCMICDTCVRQLEASLKFRRQIDASLKYASENKVPADDVKEEDDSDFGDTGDVFSDVLVKKEPHEYRLRTTRKRSLTSTKKKKVSSSKKPVELADTKKLLESGLFPFKMGKKGYTCLVCPETSKNLDDIQVHMKKHSIPNIHLAYKKLNASNLQRFIQSSTKFSCKVCQAEILNYEALKNHITTCILVNANKGVKYVPFKLEKDQLDCPVCQKKFMNFVNLNIHMNIHYPNYICDSCGKAFASQARLQRHTKIHATGEFPCKYCDATFDRVPKREQHVLKEHRASMRYACKACSISFSSFYARQKHLAEVHNEELKRYKCKACTKSYITPSHLSSHVRREHMNERNHKCTHCDLAFYSRNCLKKHMTKHDGERIHTCNICHRAYKSTQSLREHNMRVHDSDKRFVCPFCGRAFSKKGTFDEHLKVHERKLDLNDRVSQLLHPMQPI